MRHWLQDLTSRLSDRLRLAREHWGFRHAVFAALAAWFLGSVAFIPASSHGDASEYHLMTESLLRHASPDLRPKDVESVAIRERRYGAGVNLAAGLLGYFPASNGSWYSYHFWGYSALVAPARGLLRLARSNDLKAGHATNALLFVFLLHQILFASRLPRKAATGLALMAAFSPAAWFVPWMHPEALAFAVVLLALVWSSAGRHDRAVLAAALGAMQNPPLLLLVALLGMRAIVLGGRPIDGTRVLKVCLAAMPAVLPPLFYLWAYGTPSLIGRESTDLGLLSVRRATELFLDLNIGLLPHLPLALLALALGLFLGRSSALRTIGYVLVLFVMALACTVTGNWNHGTAGPSRYAVWLAAIVLYGAAGNFGAAVVSAGWRERAWTWLIALAVVGQAANVVMRGGLQQGLDSDRHSTAARVVLTYAPRLYRPSPTIFVARTRGLLTAPTDEMAVFRSADGRCRKAWARPKDAKRLLAECGALPADVEAALAHAPRRREWSYVDF